MRSTKQPGRGLLHISTIETMMLVAWVSDIHFDFLYKTEIHQFLRSIKKTHADAVFISGDIGQASSVVRYLEKIGNYLERPIYFILGNHDYYHGSIRRVRSLVRRLHRTSDHLHWVTDAGVIPLNHDTVLVGHGAWGDGRLGDFERSSIRLNDFRLIRDLSGLSRSSQLKKIMRLGDEAARHFRNVLHEAAQKARRIIVLTHVPPFGEVLAVGQPSLNGEHLPFFGCKAVGDVLLAFMHEHPNHHMIVLCGHSHQRGHIDILPNLEVFSSHAVYGYPEIQEIFDLT